MKRHDERVLQLRDVAVGDAVAFLDSPGERGDDARVPGGVGR
jgi:hypothetical protein